MYIHANSTQYQLHSESSELSNRSEAHLTVGLISMWLRNLCCLLWHCNKFVRNLISSHFHVFLVIIVPYHWWQTDWFSVRFSSAVSSMKQPISNYAVIFSSSTKESIFDMKASAIWIISQTKTSDFKHYSHYDGDKEGKLCSAHCEVHIASCVEHKKYSLLLPSEESPKWRHAEHSHEREKKMLSAISTLNSPYLFVVIHRPPSPHCLGPNIPSRTERGSWRPADKYRDSHERLQRAVDCMRAEISGEML